MMMEKALPPADITPTEITLEKLCLEEGDHNEWTTQVGLKACWVRHPRFGHLCGYVEIPKGHPCHGLKSEFDVYGINVHGGVTFLGPLSDHHNSPEDTVWMGFDCAHGGDLLPDNPVKNITGYGSAYSSGVYRTAAYVRAECEQMARQIKNFKPSEV